MNSTKLNQSAVIAKAENFRVVGHKQILSKNYEYAAYLYTAALQELDGHGGKIVQTLRCKYGMTLAECYYKLGKYNQAIARYTDVIDELPEMNISNIISDTKSKNIDKMLITNQSDHHNNYNELNKILCKALYRRSSCFLSMDYVIPAIYDINKAILCCLEQQQQQDDIMIDNIYSLKVEIINYMKEKNMNEEEILLSSTISQENNEDIIESICTKYPRQYLNSQEIKNILNKSKQISNNKLSSFQNSNPFATTGTLPSSTLPDMSGLLGNLGSLKSSFFTKQGLNNMVNMVGMLGGWDQATQQMIKEICAAFFDVGNFFKLMFNFVSRNHVFLSVALTTIWILFTIKNINN